MDTWREYQPGEGKKQRSVPVFARAARYFKRGSLLRKNRREKKTGTKTGKSNNWRGRKGSPQRGKKKSKRPQGTGLKKEREIGKKEKCCHPWDFIELTRERVGKGRGGTKGPEIVENRGESGGAQEQNTALRLPRDPMWRREKTKEAPIGCEHGIRGKEEIKEKRNRRTLSEGGG